MSVAQITCKGVEIYLPWNGRQMILYIPLEQALQEEIPTKLKTQLKWVKIFGGKLKRIFTVNETIRAQIWFPEDGDALEKFLTVKDLKIESYAIQIQYFLNSSICVDVHEKEAMINALERKRQNLGNEVDEAKKFMNFMEEKEGKFYGAYTKGRSSTVNMEIFFKNKRDWLAAIGALE